MQKGYSYKHTWTKRMQWEIKKQKKERMKIRMQWEIKEQKKSLYKE